MPEPTQESIDTQLVTCPDCGSEQADMGRHVCCESCGYGPMPYHDDNGTLRQ
ncbi:MAG: hypothetical protein WC421_02905 [Elusimicrobiales bacterium]